MSFPYQDQIADLNNKAVRKYLGMVLSRLAEYVESSDDTLDAETSASLLENMIEMLDSHSEQDEFGTEGWRHWLGLE